MGKEISRQVLCTHADKDIDGVDGYLVDGVFIGGDRVADGVEIDALRQETDSIYIGEVLFQHISIDVDIMGCDKCVEPCAMVGHHKVIVVEPYSRLVESSACGGIPFDFTFVVGEVEAEIAGLDKSQSISDKISLCTGDGVAAVGLDDKKLIDILGVELACCTTDIHRLIRGIELAFGLVAQQMIVEKKLFVRYRGRGVDDKKTVACDDSGPFKHLDFDAAFGIVDGIEDLCVVVVVAFAKETFLYTDIGGVVVLVEHSIYYRNLSPLGIGGELHFACSKE